MACGVVLILGSGPSVTEAETWSRDPFETVVAINNAWRVRSDWDFLIYPEDFPEERMPERPQAGQLLVTYKDFVPAQNRFGGFVYAGGTMAFTAAYWALAVLRPQVLAFLGCDMVYPVSGPTHFYGKGTADPLRPDITLQSLEAKAARLEVLAACEGCGCVNLSSAPSRLGFRRSTAKELAEGVPELPELDGSMKDAALRAEDALGYRVASGRYWEELERFDPAELAKIDALWLSALPRRSATEQHQMKETLSGGQLEKVYPATG